MFFAVVFTVVFANVAVDVFIFVVFLVNAVDAQVWILSHHGQCPYQNRSWTLLSSPILIMTLS